jgi:hypothetical protein
MFILPIYIYETHTHISKTEFVTSFFDVSMSDFDLYILTKYLFIPLLVLCIPILGAQLCSYNQRWAATLANRSNARHRSNIRAPPRPLPRDLCIHSVRIWVARGAGSNS